MEIRKGTPLRISLPLPQSFSIFYFLFSIFFLASGCGAPGEPTPPSPPIPAAVTDLSARQLGDGVQLTFTLPTNAVSGARLTAPPAVEVLRGSLNPDGSPDAKSFRVVYTIPGAIVDNYRLSGQVRFSDPLTAEETKAHPGETLAYIIRTRVSRKRASDDSNVVSVRVFPVPERIVSLNAAVTESAIELTWPAPTHTSAGDPVPAALTYRIYRSEINPTAPAAPSPQAPSRGKREVDAAPLATSDNNSYRDTSFSFDHTYVYIVRSVVQAESVSIESADSESLTLTPRDTFPPAAPQGVIAAVLPGSSPNSFLVDLSWSINLETDLAGYHVYKSEQEGTVGKLVTPDLLPTPAVRDTSVEPGHSYWYTVTAVDRAGNESAPSAAVAVDLTQPPS